MKPGLLYSVLAIIYLIVLGVSNAAAQSSPMMSADQARQALLPYVQSPDTTLSAAPVTDNLSFVSPLLNHPDYMFWGDSNGGFGARYWIDPVNGNKSIQYRDLSTWNQDPATAPVMLSSAQLTQIATSYAAAHFPGYSVSTITSANHGNPATAQSSDFYVFFGAQAPSGAWLPIKCRVVVEGDIGHVSDYEEEYIPVTISTIPTLTQDQAVTAGKQWIQTNYSSDPNDATVVSVQDSDDGQPIALQVNVDQANNQLLEYRIQYYGLVLFIDAQTGAVVSTDTWAATPAGFGKKGTKVSALQHRKRSLHPEEREDLWSLAIGTKEGLTNHRPIYIQHQTYLWAGYLPVLKAQWQQQKGHVALVKEGQTVKLRLFRSSSSSAKAAWLRQGSLYIPVAAVRKICPAVAVDEKQRLVKLNAE